MASLATAFLASGILWALGPLGSIGVMCNISHDCLAAGLHISLAEIAKEEGKGERQVRLLMPLAFLPPASVRGLVEGKMTARTVTELAKNVPLIW